MRKWFLCLIILCLSTPLMARTPYLILEGDEILFDGDTSGVTANGQVALEYQGFIATSNQFLYGAKTGNVEFPNPFVFYKPEPYQYITGSSFKYSVKDYEGDMHDLDADFGRVKITGKRVHFGKNKITIYDATFTSCDHAESKSHYAVEAKKMFVYPQWGYFIAINNKIHIGFLPVYVPIPTYIYGAKRYGLSSTSSLIPDVGSNKTEGFYIKERIAYFANEESQGAVLFGTTEQFGLYFGFEHGMSFVENQELYMTGTMAQRDEGRGRMEYRWNLAKNKKKKSDEELDWIEAVLRNFKAGQDLPLSQASLILAHREIMNDERVNYSPVFKVETNDIPLGFQRLRLTSEASYGKVGEERDNLEIFQSWRQNLETMLYRRDKLSKRWSLKSQLNYSGYWYDTNQTWQRLYTKFTFKYDWDVLNPEFSYTKRLMPNVGFSPFNFESNHALVSDEVGMKVSHQFRRLYLAASTDYDLLQEEVRNLDFVVGFTLQCWKAFVKIRTQQEAIEFGMDVF